MGTAAFKEKAVGLNVYLTIELKWRRNMKNLTAKQKAGSVTKWQAIIRNMLDEEEQDYFKVAWHHCGFCEAAGEIGTLEFTCPKCDLYKAVNRIRVCQEDGDCRTHASMALDLATKGRFKRALTHAETVLAAILAAEVEE